MKSINLGTLELGKQIGQGGYGTVYEANLKNIGHTVAVKILDPSPFQGAGSLDRFIQEAKILLSLRHPHIISIYGVGVYDDKPYIMMELFKGFDLYKAREKTPSPMQLLPFIRMTASALGYAHTKSVVHRDLKPNNLMTVRGDARVIDFGISKIVDPESKRFTRSGGTPVGNAFTAPELIEDPRLIDPKCDIYSLAACWYWILTGQAPNGRNWESALTAVNGMTPEYSAILLKALDQPDRRFATMEELIGEVCALESGKSTSSHDELFMDDDSMMVLGLVYEQEDPGDEGVSTFTLEKQVNQSISKIRMKLALDRLVSRRLLEVRKVAGWGEEYTAYFVTADGKQWVSQQFPRIERLLQTITSTEIADTPQLSDDSIPF